ncbi:MAG: nuclease-related domain-containing protein [Pseudomonadota bacterium]
MFQVYGLPLAGGAAVVVLLLVWLVYRRRTAVQREINSALRAVSRASLRDIVIPDVVNEQIHLDYLLLTPKGLLVLDLRDMPGVVFAGDNLEEWTLLDGHERFGFTNPLGPLRAKIESVKSLVTQVPVHGRVAFTARASFPKGKPDLVTSLPELVEEFGWEKDSAAEKSLDAFHLGWERVKRAALN